MNHSSAEGLCFKPKPGHKVEATAANTMGGSQKQANKAQYAEWQREQYTKCNRQGQGPWIKVKRSLMKLADFNKITVQSNYDTKHYEVPPDREVEEREDNREEHCDGKGSISFLVPAAVEKRQQQRFFDQERVKNSETCKIR